MGVLFFAAIKIINIHQWISTPKYSFMPKTIITSYPETKIEMIKFVPRDQATNRPNMFYVLKKAPIISENPVELETKNKDLVSIIKALQGHSGSKSNIPKYHTEHTFSANTSNASPQHSTNSHINHQVINGQSYVYNVNNYGTHYHNYDPTITKNSKPHLIDFISPHTQKANENHKKNEWVNDVKLS